MNKDRSRLPKWAQQEMERLERQVNWLEGQVHDLTNTPLVETDRYGDHQWRTDSRIGIGDFHIKPLPDGIEVMHTGWKSMHLAPSASNVIRLLEVER